MSACDRKLICNLLLRMSFYAVLKKSLLFKRILKSANLDGQKNEENLSSLVMLSVYRIKVLIEG